MLFADAHRKAARAGCLSFERRMACFCAVWSATSLTVGCAVAADTSLKQRLASAVVLQEFNTEGAFVQQSQVAQNLVVLQLRKPDSTIVVGYNLNGKQRFRLSLGDASCWLGQMRLSEDGSTLVIPEAVGPEYWDHKVFDSKGTLRFRVDQSATLLPSPTGEYFCNLFDEISSERPTIYDKRGKTIREFEYPWYAWNAQFLDDEHLIIADRDTAWFVATASGEVTRTVLLNHGIRNTHVQAGMYGPPAIRVSRPHSCIALYGEDYSNLLSLSGNVLSDHWFGGSSPIAFNDSAPWIAFVSGSPGESGEIWVVSVTDPEQTVGTPPMKSLAGWYQRDFKIISFSQNMITIWQPSPAVVEDLEPEKEYSTLFMEFNPDSLSLSQPVIMPGLYWPLENQRGQMTFLRIQPVSSVALIAIPEKNNKAKH